METTTSRPLTTTAMACLLQGVGGGLGWSLLPPLMPDIARDLAIGPSMTGVVWGAAPLGIALAAIAGGAVVDRFGPRRIAGAAMLFGALACAARALAVDPWTLTLAMFAFGLHIGFVAPAVPKALASHVPLARLGRANGLALLAYTLGTAATVWLGRTHIAPALGGWRATMVVAGGAMAAAGVLWLVIVRDRGALAGHASLGSVLSLARHGQLRKVAAMHFLLFGGYLALLGMLPLALLQAGLAPAAVGRTVGLWLVAAGVANLAGPWLSDRIGLRRPVIVAGACIAGASLVGVAAAPADSAVWMLIAAALGGGSFAPLMFTLPVESDGIGAPRAGAALGLLMLVGQLGGFLMPVAIGWVSGAFGFRGALIALAVAHALIAVPALAMTETGRAASRGDSEASTTSKSNAAAVA